jgi:hypothetical protein
VILRENSKLHQERYPEVWPPSRSSLGEAIPEGGDGFGHGSPAPPD